VSVPGADAPTLTWKAEGNMRWLEGRLGVARVIFTTRRGGVSREPYDSLNLGPLGDDDPQNVESNRSAALGALGLDPTSLAFARQAHGIGVTVARRPSADLSQEADAQVAVAPGVVPLVVVADCYPVAVACPGGVALVHCGWRGTAAGVLERAVEALLAETGREREDLSAAIGPGIGSCCYRVGPDVLRAFGLPADVEASFDLGEQVGTKLINAGVDPAQIVSAGMCTSCNPDLFFSYRRDGTSTGRQAGFGWLN